MAQRDHRLHAAPAHLREQLVVIPQTGFVGLGFVAVGENPRPGNTRAECLEPHPFHECEILVEAMIKIDRLMTEIYLVGFQHRFPFLPLWIPF